jgi:hypothetical protein
MEPLERNRIPLYSYFFVVQTNSRTLSKIILPEFKMYKFENPVSSKRGTDQLKKENVTEIRFLTDDQYKKESFTHPKYRNQKNEFIKMKLIANVVPI